MSEWNEEIRKIYRSHIEEELSLPEVLKARKQLAAHFTAQPPVSFFEPAFALSALCLVALFFFFLHIQPPPRKVVLPETRPVMLALNPTPVTDSVKPADFQRVIVKKVSSEVGSTMVYQKKHHDTSITVIWVFPGGRT